MEDKTCIFIMIGILLLVYYMNKESNSIIEKENNEYIQKKINKNSLIEGNENEESEISEENSDGELNFNEELKNRLRQEHSMCPHMNVPSRMSVAIHYPPHNTGYILSLCCDSCLKHIQDKFKEGDEKYYFDKEGNDMFFYGENGKQLVLTAKPYHINIMREITGHRMY